MGDSQIGHSPGSMRDELLRLVRPVRLPEVVAGTEREMFDASGSQLGHTDCQAGEVTWFTPPGDIHQVRNAGATTAVSIHVYGADLRRAGSSVRRYYHQPADSEFLMTTPDDRTDKSDGAPQ
jgi:hypothetical protein